MTQHDFVPALVAAQAASRPEALAVADGETRLTYGELDAAAERLASHLRALGVGPDVVVALCLESSAATVVGALGVLKSGGAYLPLDPGGPPERLAALLREARPPAVLAAACRAERLPRGDWRLVGLDPRGGVAGPRAAEPAGPPASEQDLAYVIYTSGSSGRPKGVEITHAGLRNLVRWHRRAFAVGPEDRATQIASVGFDAAVWELWPHLAAGASVHVPPPALRAEPAALRDWLVAERITVTFLSTPLAERLLDLPWPRPGSLRLMLTGADTLRRFAPADLPFALVNNYGPTECTVVATSGRVPPVPPEGGLPTIGRPIDGVTVHVLDRELCEVPAGTPGELHIGGAGVARGYLRRPDLTAQRFVPDPFDPRPRARLYKTGDLGRRLPDGQIAFLGRLDEQVQIRGQRVEPAEVAAALLAHPAVLECAVLARELRPGETGLVAWLVTAPGAQPGLAELRAFLARRLPDYMLPAAFVPLEELPRTASGKLEAARLPPPGVAGRLRDEEPVEPRTPLEARVAGILAPLLGQGEVGVHDNFFARGGHSLLGTQLIARLREVFSVELPLRALFEAPTVAGLAAEVERLLVQKVEALSEDEALRLLR